LPSALRTFDTGVEQSLGVGAVGKVGVLSLTLARIGATTRVRRQFQRAPLQLYQPVYLDPGRPDMAFLYLLQAGDGLVQGDRYRVDICCEPDAAAHVTTLSTTNVFAARQNYASQLVNLEVGPGAFLEYLPDPVVPFRGSRFFQQMTAVVDQSATIIFGETLVPGRIARHEIHAYDAFIAETLVRRQDGTEILSDTLSIVPAQGDDPESLGLLGPAPVVASLYMISEQADSAKLVRELRAGLNEAPDVSFGVSELPNRAGAVVRILGPSSRAVKSARLTAWHSGRMVLLGVPPPYLRKGDQYPMM
jgi:urease accessory protein